MSHKRFTPVKTSARAQFHRRVRNINQQTSEPTTVQEIVRFCICILLIFAGIVGLPTAIAHIFHRGPMPDITAWLHTSDAKINVRVYDTVTSSSSNMALNTYILDVLAAECTPSTPLQSLEAAAVATRTYAVRALDKESTGSSYAASHGADVTDDGQLDLPLASASDIEDEYPDTAFQFLSQIKAAIETTDGLVLTYKQQPILAFMFDLSPGMTRSGQTALHQNLPYLKAISCPDDKADPDRVATNRFESREVAQVFSAADIQLAKLQMDRLKDGFVSTVTYQNHTLSGTDFANQLHLPSADFTWKVDGDTLVITSYGRGTDIGMSLHEADVMATKGDSWKMIVSHFYPSAKVQVDGAVMPAKTS
ncbi:SpoIID/LytB domain-containing protein [Alicyclobacillus fodiniaquatilis]|uniref:SpoIID/LytB domain-containing protein n=1 Tax=Alicyclobacillus fodiniaquatilis TaxID=1661150 RepID=A0ABW4JLU3_9BACL